jgi:hypothetical protein
MASILRAPAARQKIGVGKTKFDGEYVLKNEADPYVPDTNEAVRRLRPVVLGRRALGFIEDEIDVLIEELRRWRNSRPLQRQKTPEKLHSARDAWRANKQREAEPRPAK